MKNISIITVSVAALVAAGGLASAQGQNEPRERPGAAAPEHKAPTDKADRQQPDAHRKSDSAKPAPTAQAPDKRDSATTFYEVLLQSQGAGVFTLRRYRRADAGPREHVDLRTTHELLEKLADDLVATIPA